MKSFFRQALYILAMITTILLFCNSACSDYHKNIGSGYHYYDEGGELKEIYYKNPDKGGFIPPTVVFYDYNRDFIVAKQKPDLPLDAIYGKDFVYNRGEDAYYYWLILKKEKVTLGPLDSMEFYKLREEYKVPKNLSAEGLSFWKSLWR